MILLEPVLVFLVNLGKQGSDFSVIAWLTAALPLLAPKICHELGEMRLVYPWMGTAT